MFMPDKIIFQKQSLDYDIGKNIYNKFKDNQNVEIIKSPSNKFGSLIQGENIYEKYRSGKKILVVGVKKISKFQSCKPSAHYQLPLVSGCMGQCEYCYLNTRLGDKPYIKVNVNIDDLLSKAEKYIEERNPQVTIFEGAATSDPLCVEPYTHLLKKSIEYFGEKELGRFRLVTKFNDIDSILNINHNSHTEIRFSINTDKVIKEYEHSTTSLKLRIEAASKALNNGYPIGFIIAPVFLYDNWKEEYKLLIHNLYSELILNNKFSNKFTKNIADSISFEIISHRYITKAKNIITKIFPKTTLPMDNENRVFKYGQFGYGKYVYTKDELSQIKDFFTKEIDNKFNKKNIKYII